MLVIPDLGVFPDDAGLVPLEMSSDHAFAVGRDGVLAIVATGDRKVEFVCWERHAIALVGSALGYPAYYPVRPVSVDPPVRAVLMDLDGTSVRSEQFWIWIIERTAASLLGDPSFQLSADDLPYVSGHSVSEHLEHCIRKYCPDRQLQEARAFYFEHTHREMQEILRAAAIRFREGRDVATGIEGGLSGRGDGRGGGGRIPRYGESGRVPGGVAPAGPREDRLGDRGVRFHGLVLPRLPEGGTGDGEGVPGHHEACETALHRPARPPGEHELHSLQPRLPAAGKGEVPRDPEGAASVGRADEGTVAGRRPECRGPAGGDLPSAELLGRERGNTVFPVRDAVVPGGGDPRDGPSRPRGCGPRNAQRPSPAARRAPDRPRRRTRR